VDNSVPEGAASYNYTMWEMIGMAQIIANYADDLPNVGVLAYEHPTPIRSLGSKYDYSIQDMRAAAMAGVPLDAQKARAARRAIEQAIDYIAALGDTPAGLPGMLNNGNVPLAAVVNAPWDTATALQIVQDLVLIEQTVITQSLETQVPDTLLLDPYSYGLLLNPMTLTGDSTLTILKHFLATSDNIKNVARWSRLTDAGAQGVTRGVCYQRDPEVLQLIIPKEFNQLPPQPKNLAFVVPCEARIGGVDIRYPLGMVYFDGTGEES
jgi:hypothetical protein